MSDYKRMTNYLYQYVNGERRESKGFAKMELTGSRYRLTLQLTGGTGDKKDGKVYMICRPLNYMDNGGVHTRASKVYIGTLWHCPGGHYFKTAGDIDRINSNPEGILVEMDDGSTYIAAWNEGAGIGNADMNNVGIDNTDTGSANEGNIDMNTNTGSNNVGNIDMNTNTGSASMGNIYMDNANMSTINMGNSSMNSVSMDNADMENEGINGLYMGYNSMGNTDTGNYDIDNSNMDNTPMNDIETNDYDMNTSNTSITDANNIYTSSDNQQTTDSNMENAAYLRFAEKFEPVIENRNNTPLYNSINYPNIRKRNTETPEISSTLTRAFKLCMKTNPFEDNELAECVALTPDEIGMLPVKLWKYVNNSFLLHGFYNFGNLLYARRETDNGTEYLLMVPGINCAKEAKMAKQFGFTRFKPVRNTNAVRGEFGYWYNVITDAV